MRTYKLYNATVSGNNLANVTIQRSGRIKSVRWAVGVDDSTDNHYCYFELSTQATSQIGTHDTLGVVDQIAWYNNLGAAGQDSSHINEQRMLDFPIAAGERLYLNNSGNASAVFETVFVDVAD